MEPDEWIVGVIRNNGSYDTLTHSGSVRPSDVDEIIFPLSLPWEDEPVLYRRSLEKVSSHEKNMGAEITYSARMEDTVPNSEQIWNIKLSLWEYPSGVFNYSELEHTEQIRNGQWDPDDLISAMERKF